MNGVVKRAWRRGALVLAVAFLVAGCEKHNPRPPKPGKFVPTADVEKVVQGGFGAWVDKAPFKKKWEPYKSSSDHRLIFTNASAIFLYIGTYHVVDGSVVGGTFGDSYSLPYRQDTSYYQDPKWGPVAVYAALRYDGKPVWLEDFYLINDFYNRTFGGGSQRPRLPPYLRLKQTHVIGMHDDYRTVVYWANNPLAGRYPFGFYQQGQIVLEVAFRCRRGVVKACLKKLSDTAIAMGLDIPEWKNATVDDLKRSDDDNTFWDAQFETIHEAGRDSPYDIAARIVDTGFELKQGSAGDITLAKDTGHGIASVSFGISDTKLTQEKFEKQTKGTLYDFALRNFYLADAKKPADGVITGHAKTWLGDEPAQVLSMTYAYPQGDEAARAGVWSLITSLDIDKDD